MAHAHDTQGRRTSAAVNVLLALAMVLGLVWARAEYGYLLFHALAELFAIAVAAGTFMVTWNLRRHFDHGYLVVLGVSFFFAACVDTLHLLAYQGMGVFPDADANLATQLWLIARYIQAAGLLIAPAFARRPVSAVAVIWSFGIATLALLSTVFVFDVFPAAFVEPTGLTQFKVWSEYLISAAMALSLVAVWRYRDTFTREVLWLLSAMIVTAVAAELAFTLYQDPYGPWNSIGHLLKVGTYFLLYRAVVETALVRPLDVLFRDLQRTAEDLAESEARFRSTFEQATIGIAHVSLDGRWLRVNRRLTEIAGYRREELLRMRPEDITHPDDRPAESALLRRLLDGQIDEYHFEKRYVRKDGTTVWVAVSRTLMHGPDGAPRYFIATVEDIAERVRREENLRRSRDLTEALRSIDLEINALTDVDEIVRTAAENGCDALGTQSAAVLLRDGERWRPGHLHRFPAEHVPEHAPGDHAVPVADEDGSPLVVGDAFSDERMSPETMRALGIRALITVPLRFRGEDLGVIYFNCHDAPHRFTEADIEFARDLSSSVSLAIENARLYAAQRLIADTLQSALLAMPSQLPGLELAHVYRSATELARIGGDFYDVFEVSDDTIAFVLGDVSGKGIEAATLTAMAKSTIRAYAYENPDPDRVLTSANRTIATQIDESRFITAVYGTIHVPTGKLVMACAGHPQPVLCAAGRCTDSAVTSEPPLGVVPEADFRPYSVTMEVGDLLVLFSDGLIEARNRSGFLGAKRVRELIEEHAGEPPARIVEALVALADQHCEGRIDDDVAIVALRYSGPQEHSSTGLQEG
jgi:PAS domain S-box-containing protein